jgi:hypothetical protein
MIKKKRKEKKQKQKIEKRKKALKAEKAYSVESIRRLNMARNSPKILRNIGTPLSQSAPVNLQSHAMTSTLWQD